jgi:hypothetical protein
MTSTTESSKPILTFDEEFPAIAADKARKLFDDQEKPANLDESEIPQFITESQADLRAPGEATRAARAIEEQRLIDFERRKKRNRRLGIGLLLVVGAISAPFAVSALNHLNGGSDNPAKFGEIDHSVTEISIDAGANIYHDPYKSVDNVIETVPDHTLVVETPEGSYHRIHGENAAGDPNPSVDWYAVTVDQIKKVDPAFDSRGDNDGYVWVPVSDAEVTSANK